MNLPEMTLDEVLAYPFPDYSWPLAIGVGWRNKSNSQKLDEAIKLFEACRSRYPHALEFGHELALAYLERGGEGDDKNAERVLQEIEALYGVANEEFLCRFGRLYKERGDRAAKAGLREEAADFYKRATHWYAEAYKVRQGHFPGINRATLLLLRASLSDDETDHTDLADESADQAAKLLARYDRWPHDLKDDNIWHPATAAEAHFLRKEWSAARLRYREALDQWNCENFHWNSMHKQARRIRDAFRQLGVTDFGPLADLEGLFAPPANTSGTQQPDPEAAGPAEYTT